MSHFGRMVTYGVASGVPAEVSNRRLLFEKQDRQRVPPRPGLRPRSGKVMKAVPELTDGLASGDLEIILGESFALEDAAAAHQYIEDRKSSGRSC